MNPAQTTPGAERRPKVLYVDDQLGNLTVFKASMRRYADIRTATSGEEALAILETEEFPIVISDQRMDGMSGSEFLSEVRKRYPDSIRILLTAYTDFNALAAAINDGQIARFVRKPWEREEMREILLNSSRLYWKSRENTALTQQLLHQARLAAVGQITAGLVHELGNMLAKLDIVEDILEAWDTGREVSQEFNILRSGIEGVRALFKTLRSYARGGDAFSLDLEWVDLNATLANWTSMMRLFPYMRGRKLEFVDAGRPVWARVDIKKFEQVLINLVRNSAEAVDETSGRIRIGVAERDGRVLMRIQDNGAGIPQEVGQKIWEPFFTTKGTAGTGLGLMMCRRILEAHDGRIHFVNNPEGGCTFTCQIPLREAVPQHLSEAKRAAA
jgi:signal transduction histidine kinase